MTCIITTMFLQGTHMSFVANSSCYARKNVEARFVIVYLKLTNEKSKNGT